MAKQQTIEEALKKITDPDKRKLAEEIVNRALADQERKRIPPGTGFFLIQPKRLYWETHPLPQ